MNEELPEGWVGVSPLAVAELVRGVSYEKGEVALEPGEGRVPLLRANNISNGIVFSDLQYVPQDRVSAEQLLRAGDVIVAMSSGSKSVVGKAAALSAPWRGTFGAFCGVLRPSSMLDARFFSLFFGTLEYRQTISELSAGTNINNLKRAYFDKLTLPLPPLAEQRRIVAKVEALLAEIHAASDRLAKVPAILKRFRQAVLAAACSGRLTDGWRGDPDLARPTGLDKPEGLSGLIAEFPSLDDVPISWRWEELGAVVADSFYGPRFGADRYCESGTPTVRTTDMNLGGRIVLKDSPRIVVGPDEMNRFCLRDGDLLVTRTGTIGKCAVYRSVLGPAIPGAYLIRFRLKQDVLLPNFALTYLLSPFGQRLLGTGQTAVAQPNVNARTIGKFPIPVPPILEQGEIIRRVDSLFTLADTVENHISAATARSDKLTQSILAKAFRGEFVTTEAELARQEDREYEAASALLERVRHERETETARGSPRSPRCKQGVSDPSATLSPRRSSRSRGNR
jgi:type I restriction enzyme S subunit